MANVVADPPTEDTVAITVKKAVTVITEDVVAVLDHQAMTEIEEEAVEIVTDITTAETEADLQDREEVATIKSAEADPLNKREIPEWKEVRDRDQTAKSTTKNLTEEAHKVLETTSVRRGKTKTFLTVKRLSNMRTVITTFKDTKAMVNPTKAKIKRNESKNAANPNSTRC